MSIALGGALGGCEPAEVTRLAPVRESALEEAALPQQGDGVVCGEPRPVILTIGPAEDDSVNVFASVGQTFDVLVVNLSELDGTAAVTFSSDSEGGATIGTAATLDMSGRTQQVVAIETTDLQLPVGAFKYSGSLVLRAQIALSDGSIHQSSRFVLYFHPTGRGWQIYDRVALEASWNHGAVSDESRARVASIFERLPPGVGLGSMRRAQISVSDDLPRPDGPPDGEAEEQ